MFYYTNIVIFSSFGISNSSSQNDRKLQLKRPSFRILIMFFTFIFINIFINSLNLIDFGLYLTEIFQTNPISGCKFIRIGK